MGNLRKMAKTKPVFLETRMKKLVSILLLAAIGGCQSETIQTSRKQAYEKWNATRAKMLYGVASEHLKTGQLERAGNKVQEALALDPKFHDARILLAKVRIELGQYDLAAAELAQVREARPDSAEAVFLLAVAQEKNKELDEALQNYRKAYAMDNKNVSALTSTAEVLVALGRIPEAQKQVESYLGTHRDDPGLHEIAGRLAIMTGQPQKAVEYFRRAQNLDHFNIPYRESLARAYFYNGQYEQAEQTLEDLLEMKNYKPGVWFHTMLGECYIGMNRPRDARRSFETATQLKPADASVWAHLAKAALACGDLDRAAISARQAMDLEPSHLEASLTLGYILVRKGQPAQAVTLLTQAVRAHPDNGMLRCVLGRAYAQSGDAARAIQCYQDAVKLDPDNQAARELLAAARPPAQAGPR